MASSEQSFVTLNPENDPEMDAASKSARQTFRYFYRELSWEMRRIIPGLDMACVKVAFRDPPEMARKSDGPSVEQMWISDVEFDGQKVSGTLLNQPNWLKSVSEGDAVSIPPSQVSDWMYAIAGRVYGGYTVNLIRSRMGRGERRSHDGAWGLNFGDPAKIHVVPTSFFGKKPGFFGKLFGGDNPIPLSEIESTEHPMALNMAPGLDEQLQQNPNMVSEVDDRGFGFIHSLTLAGTPTCVQILLKHGANPNAVTKNGMTPIRLAKSLGWGRVAQVLEKAGGK